MNTEYFIAQRLYKRDLKVKSLSFLITRITIIAVSLSIATMIVAIAIVIGFRSEIERKLSGFVGHIVITKQTTNQSLDLPALPLDSTVIEKISSTRGVKYVQVFAIKPGLIKHKNYIQGVILKGVWRDFNWHFFDQYLIAGHHLDLTPQVCRSVIVSQELANMLDYELNDYAFMLFVQDPPRLRKYKITGIYNTGLIDFDKVYLLSDIRQIQKLNNWTDTSFMISGYEVFVKDFRKIDQIAQQLKIKVAFGLDPNKTKLQVQTLKELYPEIFDWLALVDMNVIVILAIMTIVALINMTSGLLIIILEKASLIGILKAIGAKNSSVRKIFLYISWFILKRGLIYGNGIALTFVILQKWLHLFPLNPEIYYVSYVPVQLNLVHLLAVNFFTIAITLIFMILPATIATRMDPVKTIRFQ